MNHLVKNVLCIEIIQNVKNTTDSQCYALEREIKLETRNMQSKQLIFIWKLSKYKADA